MSKPTDYVELQLECVIVCEDGSVVRDYGGERVPQYIFDHLNEWGFTYDGGQQ